MGNQMQEKYKMVELDELIFFKVNQFTFQTGAFLKMHFLCCLGEWAWGGFCDLQILDFVI